MVDFFLFFPFLKLNGLKLDFFWVSLSSSPENGVNGYYEKSIRAVALHKSRFEIDNTKGGALVVWGY